MNNIQYEEQTYGSIVIPDMGKEKPETIEYAENQMKLSLIQIKEYISSGTTKNSNKPLVEVF